MRVGALLFSRNCLIHYWQITIWYCSVHRWTALIIRQIIIEPSRFRSEKHHKRELAPYRVLCHLYDKFSQIKATIEQDHKKCNKISSSICIYKQSNFQKHIKREQTLYIWKVVKNSGPFRGEWSMNYSYENCVSKPQFKEGDCAWRNIVKYFQKDVCVRLALQGTKSINQKNLDVKFAILLALLRL